MEFSHRNLEHRQMNNIGLFFGSFNPIHNGHLILAQYMLEFVPLDEVWFVITPRSPFKEKETLADDYRRLDMVNLAIAGNERLRASDVEFRLPQPNFTVNTLAVLAEKYPNRHFHLIMGGDNLASFGKWRNYSYILENYKLLVYPRSGSEEALLQHDNIRIVDAPMVQISSSFIRESLREGRDMRYFLPEAVYQYLQQNSVY
jgi:nicotinate-nucleotide adenylyltransferase